MKIKLLIATEDSDYTEHLSNILMEKYADTFEVGVCSSGQRLHDLLSANRYDVILSEPQFVSGVNVNSVRLPLALTDEAGSFNEIDDSVRKIKKYQRVSSIVGSILENYAEISDGIIGFGVDKAQITVVWSPAGGAGKTTVALAYSANKVSNGKRTVYLNMENFSGAPAYFSENGKSISKAFEKLDTNVHIYLMSIRQQDSGSGILYFCSPENFDDMNILTPDDIETLVSACAIETDELVIDLSSQCDEKVQKVLYMADKVLLVCEPSGMSQKKVSQFIHQHNVFSKIQSKITLVNNKGARNEDESIDKMIQLPLVQSTDPVSIYKTLSSGSFDW